MNTQRLGAARFDRWNSERSALIARLWRLVTFGGRLARRASVVLWLAALIGLSLYSGWSWLVAAGLASTVLAFLPCAAMCALGLCAGSGRNCADKGADSWNSK